MSLHLSTDSALKSLKSCLTFFSLDCTNVEDLTKAEMEGREQAMYALQALKKVIKKINPVLNISSNCKWQVVPGFEEAKLRNFGMTIGTRDSRKIIARFEKKHHWYVRGIFSQEVIILILQLQGSSSKFFDEESKNI